MIFIIVYLDDILFFSNTPDEHTSHVRQVLKVLKKEKLYLKMFKSEFGKTTLVYFGHIIGGGELNIDPSKFDVTVIWPKPNNVIEVRSFLGETQYWRKIIANSHSLQHYYMH